jgi:hypothetical protein
MKTSKIQQKQKTKNNNITEDCNVFGNVMKITGKMNNNNKKNDEGENDMLRIQGYSRK